MQGKTFITISSLIALFTSATVVSAAEPKFDCPQPKDIVTAVNNKNDSIIIKSSSGIINKKTTQTTFKFSATTDQRPVTAAQKDPERTTKTKCAYMLGAKNKNSKEVTVGRAYAEYQSQAIVPN